MLKLLIADDEHRVCQLIEKIIPWEEYDVKLTGVAYNGIDAFELIKELQPDIVITDIRMPGYDGISLIEKTRKLDSDISFIIVSGYRDFEYAQKALKFGAEDYLLKPISGDELKRIVQKVIGKKLKNAEKEDYESRLKFELSRNRETLRRALAKEFLDRDFNLGMNDFLNLQEYYNISFKSLYFQTVIIQLDNQDENIQFDNSEAENTMLEKTESMISSIIEGAVCEYFSVIQRRSIIYILNTFDTEGLNHSDLELLLENSSQKIAEYGKWTATICVGRTVEKIENLNFSFREALFARKDRIIQGTGKIIRFRAPIHADDDSRRFNYPVLYEKMKRIFESNETEQVKALFSELLVFPHISGRIKNPEIINNFFVKLSEMFGELLITFGSEGEEAAELKRKTEFIIEISESVPVIQSRLSVLFSSYLSRAAASKKLQNYKPVRIAKEYIEKNFAENIELSTVAGKSGLNPVYFSTLFKKETGTNFKEYLQHVRIERAKQMLVSGNDTIVAISESVGYKDVRYFSRIFTRTVGIKPNMYRKIYG